MLMYVVDRPPRGTRSRRRLNLDVRCAVRLAPPLAAARPEDVRELGPAVSEVAEHHRARLRRLRAFEPREPGALVELHDRRCAILVDDPRLDDRPVRERVAELLLAVLDLDHVLGPELHRVVELDRADLARVVAQRAAVAGAESLGDLHPHPLDRLVA